MNSRRTIPALSATLAFTFAFPSPGSTDKTTAAQGKDDVYLANWMFGFVNVVE